jgi:hypothetical protein
MAMCATYIYARYTRGAFRAPRWAGEIFPATELSSPRTSGRYTVTVTMTDEGGQKKTLSQRVEIAGASS